MEEQLNFRVERAGAGANARWQTICRNPSEKYAREVFEKQLKLTSVGRFRLLDPEGKVLAEARAKPLFQREDQGDEQRPPTYYAPEPSAPRPG